MPPTSVWLSVKALLPAPSSERQLAGGAVGQLPSLDSAPTVGEPAWEPGCVGASVYVSTCLDAPQLECLPVGRRVFLEAAAGVEDSAPAPGRAVCWVVDSTGLSDGQRRKETSLCFGPCAPGADCSRDSGAAGPSQSSPDAGGLCVWRGFATVQEAVRAPLGRLQGGFCPETVCFLLYLSQ